MALPGCKGPDLVPLHGGAHAPAGGRLAVVVGGARPQHVLNALAELLWRWMLEACPLRVRTCVRMHLTLLK